MNRRTRRLAAAAAALLLALSTGAALAESRDPGQLFEQGMTARQAGDFPLAIEAFEKLVQRQPGNADALLMLGTLYGFETRFAEAERTLRRGLDLAPDYHDIALALARVLAWQDRFAEAEAQVARVLAQSPDQVEALTLRARIAFYRQRYGQAEQDFLRAEELAPNTLDSLVGLGDVAAAQGREQAARRYWLRAQAVDPASRDVRQRLDRLGRGEGPRWRLDLIGSLSELSGDRPPWREASVQLTHLLNRSTDLFARLEGNERFERRDWYLEAGAIHRFSAALTGSLSLGGAPEAQFREQFALGAGLSARIAEGQSVPVDAVEWIGPTLLTLDLRHASYRDGTSLTVRPGVEQYLLDGQLMLAGQAILSRQDGTWRPGWSARADLAPEAWRGIGLSVGYAAAPELSDGRVADTFTWFAGVRLPLPDGPMLRLDVAEEHRRDVLSRAESRRTSVTFGIGIRF